MHSNVIKKQYFGAWAQPFRPLLEVKDLTLSFNDGKEVLSRVSLTIWPGEKLGLSGPSGSGKSLLASAITGLLPEQTTANQGEIIWRGNREVVDLLLLDRAGFQKLRGSEIAIIWQEPATALNPTHRIKGQVLEALHLKPGKQAEAAFSTLMTKVSLGAELDRLGNAFPHELSGGQLQRADDRYRTCPQPKTPDCR